MAIRKTNLDILVNDYIKVINKNLKLEGKREAYAVHIITKGKSKKLMLYSGNLDTGERTIMYQKEYEVKNPAQFLTTDVNFLLYRELFYNCFAFYAVNMEAIAKQRIAERAVDEIAPGVKEHPMTPDDAFAKTLKDAEANS